MISTHIYSLGICYSVFPRYSQMPEFYSQYGCTREKETLNWLWSSSRMRRDLVAILVFSWFLYMVIWLCYFSLACDSVYFSQTPTWEMSRDERFILGLSQFWIWYAHKISVFLASKQQSCQQVGFIWLSDSEEKMFDVLQGTGKWLQHSGCDHRGHKVVKCLPYLYDWDQLEAACLEVRAWKMICSTINWWCLNLSYSSSSSYFLPAKMHFLKSHCSIYFY